METLAIFSLSFVCFTSFSAPALYFRDSGELTTAGFNLGVAHETGFSLYCLLAKLFLLLPLGEVALRANLFSALCGAIGCALLYQLTLVVLGQQHSTTPTAKICASVSALCLLSTWTYFKAATVAEVYAVSTAALVLGIFWLLRSSDRVSERAGQAGVRLGLLGGLSLGLHAHVRVLLAPLAVVWAFRRLRQGAMWPKLAAAAVALGLAVVCYLPIRAHVDPPLNWANPHTIRRVMDHLSAARIRAAFQNQILTLNPAALRQQARLVWNTTGSQCGFILWLMAAGGVVVCFARRPFVAGVLLWIALIDTIYSIWINPMGVADLQTGTPLLLVVCTLAGFGLFAATEKLTRSRPWAAALIGLITIISVGQNHFTAKISLAPEADAWSRAALASAEPRALVFATSDDLAAGLLYQKAVAGMRPDVTVLVTQQLWDRELVYGSIRRSGDEIHSLDAWRKGPWPREAMVLQKLMAGEIGVRQVLWEPGDTPAPVAAATISLDVPLQELLPAAAPLAPGAIAAVSSKLGNLLRPAQDPLAQELVAVTLNGVGRTLWLKQERRLAEQSFRMAGQIWPENTVARNNLAVCMAARGEYGGARELLEKILAADPTQRMARLNLALFLYQQGDYAAAKTNYQLLLAQHPEDDSSLLGLARIALVDRNFAMAEKLARRALAANPYSEEARSILDKIQK